MNRTIESDEGQSARKRGDVLPQRWYRAYIGNAGAVPGTGFGGKAIALFSCKVKVYRAIIDVQSAKLNNDNVRVRDYQVAMGRAEVSIMERRLEEYRQRVKLAISILSFRPFR